MKNLNLYGPFLWKGFNCLKAAKPPRGKILLFTTQSPGNPGTHLIDLRRMSLPQRHPAVLNGLINWESSALTTTIIK